MSTTLRKAVCLLPLCGSAQRACAQVEVKPPASRFVNVGDVRIHYLDFGGQGLPILLLPTGDRTALHYKDFGPRFVDRHRVLAITPRGTGESGGKMSDVPTRVRDILALLDTLRIRRAVMIGNTIPSLDMTYFAEHYPDRVAGLVYLSNAPDNPLPDSLDPTGESRLSTPALTFVNKEGKTRGFEHFNVLLMVAEQVGREGGRIIPDSMARVYFERLARDSTLQAQVRKFWQEQVIPKSAATNEAFYRAFGDHLQIVSLDVPFVSGYEYSTAPDLIYPHIRQFLDKLRRSP